MDRSALPRLIKAAQYLFYLNALIWLAFGTINIARMVSGNAEEILSGIIFGSLMFGNVALLAGAGLGLKQPYRRYLYFAIVLLLINLLLTITDEFGWFDFLTLILDLVILVLLIYSRKYYFGSKEKN